MSLPLSLLICLSVFHLCLGTEPVKRFFRRSHWSDASPDSENVQNAAKYAEELFNKEGRGKEVYELKSINSAKTKGTTTIKYKIDAVFKKKKCPKWKNPDVKSCILDQEKILCQVVVALKPRKQKYSLKSKTCNKVTKKG